MPPTRSASSSSRPSSSSKKPAGASVKAAAAGVKRQATTEAASEPSTSSAPLKKSKATPAASQPKSILKKSNSASSSKTKPSASAAKPATNGKAKLAKRTPAASASRAGATKKAAKSPLTATKPVVSDDDEDEDDDADYADDADDASSLDSDEEEDLIKGLTSDEGEGEEDGVDGQDSSDEEQQAGDDDGDDSSDDGASDEDGEVRKLSSLAGVRGVQIAKLPSSKDDAAVRSRLDKLSAKRARDASGSTPSAAPASNKNKVRTGTLYVGHLPRHFDEDALRGYFSQFGTLTRLRLSRNKKTGRSKHYGFLEFADGDVADIVQETMDNYLLMSRLLKVKRVDKAGPDGSATPVHPKLWVGANRKFRVVPEGRRTRVQHDGPKDDKTKKRAEQRLMKRQAARRNRLQQEGYDYQFEGYQKV